MWPGWRLVLRISIAKAAYPAHRVQTLLKRCEPAPQSIETSRPLLLPRSGANTSSFPERKWEKCRRTCSPDVQPRSVVLVIAIRPRSEHKMKRSTRQSHWEGSLSVYAHHHAACLDNGVRGFAGGELQFFGANNGSRACMSVWIALFPHGTLRRGGVRPCCPSSRLSSLSLPLSSPRLTELMQLIPVPSVTSTATEYMFLTV